MPESIEGKLAAALGGVEAPGELWTRVNAALPAAAMAPRRASATAWPRFVMAAAIAALMSGGVMYLRAQASRVSYGPASLAAAAVTLHQTGSAPAAATHDAGLLVERLSVLGQPVTILSEAAPGAQPEQPKHVRTTETGTLAVSEWTQTGRRWVMVTSKGVHLQACAICHRA